MGDKVSYDKNWRNSELRKRGTNRRYAFATCPVCGKRGYNSKQEAKGAAKLLYPGSRMRVYECGTLWHMTSQDAETTAQCRERQVRP